MKIPRIPPELVAYLERLCPEVTPAPDWAPDEFIWAATRRGLVLEIKATMAAQQRRAEDPGLDDTPADER